MSNRQPTPFWAALIHLSFNMWFDRRDLMAPGSIALTEPSLRLDDRLWRDLTDAMARAGLTMAVLDLGDAIRYESHPEIAVQGAWSPGRLRRELARLRALGLEPIPKLNFSAGHDNWLGPYARCVSTPAYYRVCADLIAEVAELFGRPRFFHLGMDEETTLPQRFNEYIVIRAGDLWWHDLAFLAREVERRGARPWVWADAHWFQPEVYERRMPRSVLQSNWWYGALRLGHVMTRRVPEIGEAPVQARPVQTYRRLARAGFDQAPAASNHSRDDNFRQTVAFARHHLAGPRLLGFLQTTWMPTLESFRQVHLAAIDQVGVEIARWRGTPVRRPVENAGQAVRVPARPGRRVGVYQGNPGAAAIVARLAERRGLNPFLLPRLERAALRTADIVVVSRAPSVYYVNAARRGLRGWVERGGRLLLMYDAAGWRAFAPPLFPEIGTPAGKRADGGIVPAGSVGGPVCRRLSWCDHLALRRGPRGTVLARDAGGRPAIVGGHCGRGRVVLCGLYLGEALDGAARRSSGSPAEWGLLARSLAWLAGNTEGIQ